MDRSKMIAGLMGPLLAAIGVGLLLNRSQFGQLAGQLAGNLGLVFLTGLLSLLAGLAIVLNHNIWSGWPALVTALGWLAIVGGLLRMWFPQVAAPAATGIGSSPAALLAAGLVMLAAGAFLSLKAFR
jgi:uncharacterized protein YjeT (DUF2065 family)